MAIIPIGIPFRAQEIPDKDKPYHSTKIYDFREKIPKILENLVSKYRAELSALSEEVDEKGAFWLMEEKGSQLLRLAFKFNQDDIIVNLSEMVKNEIFNINCSFHHYMGIGTR
jgi:hypothetical protein